MSTADAVDKRYDRRLTHLLADTDWNFRVGSDGEGGHVWSLIFEDPGAGQVSEINISVQGEIVRFVVAMPIAPELDERTLLELNGKLAGAKVGFIEGEMVVACDAFIGTMTVSELQHWVAALIGVEGHLKTMMADAQQGATQPSDT